MTIVWVIFHPGSKNTTLSSLNWIRVKGWIHQIVSPIVSLRIYELFPRKLMFLFTSTVHKNKQTNSVSLKIRRFVVSKNSWNHLMNSLKGQAAVLRIFFHLLLPSLGTDPIMKLHYVKEIIFARSFFPFCHSCAKRIGLVIWVFEFSMER